MADRPRSDAISATPDDASGYRRGAAGRRRGAAVEGSRMIGMNLIMAVLVAGLVVAGWFIANQHQLLADEQQALDAAEARIVVLEDRLRVTDEAMAETGQDTQQQIGFWESEIRKLWAVSNERNRKWIMDNQAALARLQKTLDELKASNAELAGAVGRHETAFSQQQAIIDQLAGIDLQMQRMVAGQRDLTDKVNVAQQSVSALQSGLAGRVSENEQAVAAIDAYRLQLNARLADIERRLNQLISSTDL